MRRFGSMSGVAPDRGSGHLRALENGGVAAGRGRPWATSPRFAVVLRSRAGIAAFAVVRTISGVAQLPKAFDPVPEGQRHIVLNADGSTLRTPP